MNECIGKFFIGEVKVIDDPKKLSRIKVHISELFNGIEDNFLPWFGLMRPIFRGSLSGEGFYSIPQIGSKVVCIFDKGDLNSGLVIGELFDNATKVDDTKFSPEVWGFIDENSTSLQVNTVERTLTITHQGVIITIDNAGKVNIVAPEVITTGTIADHLGTLDEMRSIFNLHVHSSIGTPPTTIMS